MNNLQKFLSNGLLASAALLAAVPAFAAVSLGSASQFAVLAGSNATCTDGTVVGDIGVSPGSAVPYTNTGCTITGAVPPATDAAAAAARADMLATYASFQYLTCIPLTGTLAGVTLSPGVYCLDAVAKTGTLTLDGPANGVWIFRVNGALTGTNFSVVMTGGAQPCNVYWAPSGAATLTTSNFKGSILAGNEAIGSITLTGGSFAGSALASVAVTITGTSVIGCSALHGGGNGGNDHGKCNQGVGNGAEGCDPGNSNNHNGSNDENGGTPGNPGRKGSN